MKKIMIALIAFITYSNTKGFCTLESAERFAAQNPELVTVKHTSLVLNPDFIDWYRAHTPGVWGHIRSFFSLTPPDWSISSFRCLLQTVFTSREKKLYPQGYTLIMRPQPGSRFVIFGPLNGAFHSLVRDLGALKKQGIIDNTFKLVHPDTYIVFNGNVVDGTPYLLETLTLILSLMHANPERVIMITGQYEFRDYWKGAGLQTELDERVSDGAGTSQLLTTFFATLPLSLILVGPKTKDTIRIVNLPQNLNDITCKQQIDQLPSGGSLICPMSKTRHGEYPVSSLIQAENRLVSYRHHPGLVTVPSESGAITWSLFSGPTPVYRTYFHFMYDAFTILTIGKSMAESTLALYNQPVENPSGFKEAAVYTVLTGRKLNGGATPVSGPQQEPIVIGCTLDLSKGVSGQGKQVKMGISLAVNEQNARGGINGRPLEIVFMDDGYSPERARRNVIDFTKKYKSSIFLCNLGTPTLESYLDLVKSGKAFIFFPITGAPVFRKPDLLTMVHWRTSYTNEARALTEYLIKNEQIQDFAFFYQKDDYGLGALAGARAVLKEHNIHRFKEVPYVRNTTNFKQAIEQIKASSASAIGFFSTAIAAAEFIRQAGVEFFIGKKLFALSDLAEQSFVSFAHEKGLDMLIAEFAPNPVNSTLQIVQCYRHAVNAQGFVKQDVFMLEGYIGARILIDIIQKAGKDLSHKNLLHSISGMKKYDFKGLTLTFDPNTRELAHNLWINTGTPEWIKQETRQLLVTRYDLNKSSSVTTPLMRSSE